MVEHQRLAAARDLVMDAQTVVGRVGHPVAPLSWNVSAGAYFPSREVGGAYSSARTVRLLGRDAAQDCDDRVCSHCQNAIKRSIWPPACAPRGSGRRTAAAPRW